MEETESSLPLDVIKHHLQLFLASNKWTAACRLVSRSWRDGIKLYNICITPQRAFSPHLQHMLMSTRGIICEALPMSRVTEIAKLAREHPQIAEFVIKSAPSDSQTADYHKTLHNLISSEYILSLRIINRSLTDDFRTILLKKLSGAVHLRTLDLSFNDITKGSVEEFLKRAPENIKKINFRGAKLRYAALSLPDNLKIEEINMSESCISNPSALLRAGIPRLILSSNYDFDKQTFLVTNLTTYQDVIQHLDISYCMLDDEAARSLARFLEKDTALEELDISGNPISESGIHVLAAALERNRTLRRLTIIDTSCNFTVAQLQRLQKARPNLTIITEREPL
eukprot:TRINITY_DN4593_c0_g1_i1.p1 TRINITY_DN4593_c0_g1~~TRINITY_DN4593_c0_g1_i1.p1  ORF type:complete len:340 (-),score=48.08 TRINITY_DN4593_c0_g1_i1:179-1198(-)